MKSAKIPSMIFLIIFLIFVFAEVICLPQDYGEEPLYRHCSSTGDTFFNGQCLPIGSTEHCPNTMELFDGPNQEGFCDCFDNKRRPAFYSDETYGCYFHNTQGPCVDGEWFVLKNNEPRCEPVPEGCPADGRHFFGSPDETMFEQCWELESQGPCPPNEILKVEENTGELKIFCEIPLYSAAAPSSTGYKPSCRPGTLRNRLGECRRGSVG